MLLIPKKLLLVWDEQGSVLRVSSISGDVHRNGKWPGDRAMNKYSMKHSFSTFITVCHPPLSVRQSIIHIFSPIHLLTQFLTHFRTPPIFHTTLIQLCIYRFIHLDPLAATRTPFQRLVPCPFFTLTFLTPHQRFLVQFERANETHRLASSTPHTRDDTLRRVRRALSDPVVSTDDERTYPCVG